MSSTRSCQHCCRPPVLSSLPVSPRKKEKQKERTNIGKFTVPSLRFRVLFQGTCGEAWWKGGRRGFVLGLLRLNGYEGKWVEAKTPSRLPESQSRFCDW